MNRGIGWALGRLFGTLSCIFFGCLDWLYRTAMLAAAVFFRSQAPRREDIKLLGANDWLIFHLGH